MLPDDKSALSVIIGKLGKPPAGGPDEGEGEGDEVTAAAEELLAALQSKDVAGVASALRAAFEVMESEPHAEGPPEGAPE